MWSVVVAGLVALAVWVPNGAQAGTLTLDGRLLYYGNQLPVADASVVLRGPSVISSTTDALGAFSFSGVDIGTWTLQPQGLTASHGGVTALDAVYALQAAVGLRTLNPTQAIACDVSGNGTLTAVDASLILQYAVGLIDRFPVAVACGSDWIFIPTMSGSGSTQTVIQPQIQQGLCQPSRVEFNPLDASFRNQDFSAAKFGDCSGDWQPPVPTPTPTVAAPTPTASSSPTRTAPPTLTPTASASPTRTASPTLTPTASASPTPTTSPSPTRTTSPTLMPTASPSSTPTILPSGTPTASPSPSPTLGCTGRESTLFAPLLLASHPDVPDATGILQPGRAHIVNVVPTSDGWGVFWLRDTTNDLWDITLASTLYYAHVDFTGRISAGPQPLVDIHRQDREPLYLVAWRIDHFGLLVNELVGADLFTKTTYQYYYDVSLDGRLSARVGPIRSDLGGSGGIGDMIPYLSGFMVGIETACQGSHQCSYAFKLADHGASRGSDLRVVEFDGTHSHSPQFADDGSGLVVISSKDANSYRGGIVSQYIYNSGSAITMSTPIIPNHGFLLDSNPRVAWNGQRFGAMWREVAGLTSPLDQNWRMRLATFRRNVSTSALLSDRFLEPTYVLGQYLGRSFSWTSNLSAVSDGWVASYARGRSDGEPEAVIEHLTQDGDAVDTWAPFTLDDYAFSARVHFQSSYQRVIGAAASHRTTGGVDVRFATLNLDCPP